MSISIKTRQAYSEIDEFLELLTDEQKNKIPFKLRELFKEEKDKDYRKVIDPRIPIREQNLREETLALIALLNLQYWCEDDEEKKRLTQIYAKNERVHNELLREKYNPDNLFKSKEEKIVEQDETNLPMNVENVSLLKKIIRFIKRFFLKTRE